jgi:hypothetical protein
VNGIMAVNAMNVAIIITGTIYTTVKNAKMNTAIIVIRIA